jgi:hypothetical protein
MNAGFLLEYEMELRCKLKLESSICRAALF